MTAGSTQPPAQHWQPASESTHQIRLASSSAPLPPLAPHSVPIAIAAIARILPISTIAVTRVCPRRRCWRRRVVPICRRRSRRSGWRSCPSRRCVWPHDLLRPLVPCSARLLGAPLPAAVARCARQHELLGVLPLRLQQLRRAAVHVRKVHSAQAARSTARGVRERRGEDSCPEGFCPMQRAVSVQCSNRR